MEKKFDEIGGLIEEQDPLNEKEFDKEKESFIYTTIYISNN